jgi:hypothetical protein
VVTKPGPTLLQARFQEGITVEKVDEEGGKGSEESSVAPAEKTVKGVDDPKAKPDATVPPKGGKP